MYNEELLNRLKNIPFLEQGAVGDSPHKWANDMEIKNNFHLPHKVLTRKEVRDICRSQNQDPLLGYLCAMAWGAQGRGPSGGKSARAAWSERNKLSKIIKTLRDEELSRSDAYELFLKSGKISGLGPAYFTKLLYFFSPVPNNYIMDQWTTKPIILLTGENVIRHSNLGPVSQNTGFNYDLFCRLIDDLAKKLGEVDGDRMEQRLFSVGSIRRQPRGPWRQIVVDSWPKREIPRYDENRLLQHFKHLY